MARLGRLIATSFVIAALALGPVSAARASMAPMPMNSTTTMCDELSDGHCGCQSGGMQSDNAADCTLHCGLALAMKADVPFMTVYFIMTVQSAISSDTLMPFIAGAPPSPPPRSRALI